MKLLVRNLARTTKEKDLQNIFAKQGAVAECALVLDQETGLSKGFAFVDMLNVEEARAAIKALNHTVIDKSKIRVKLANE